MAEQFLTPVGRMVQGDPFEAQTKNMKGQPLVTKAGHPTQRYFCAVAFSKVDASFAELYASMVRVARAGFPHLFNAQGQCTHPRFSWKIMDGDGIDDNGRQNSTKPGFAGHWVVKFQTSFPPRCFHAGRYQPHEQIQDPKAIPCGYYVRIAGAMEPNGDTDKPGLYMNMSMVELVGGQPSDIIVSGPDASVVFGGAPAQLPAGVSAPVLPQTAAPSVTHVIPEVSGAPRAMNIATPTLNQVPIHHQPQVAVAPNPSFLQPGAALPAVPGLPQATQAPVAPSAPTTSPSEPQLTAAAGPYTYRQYIDGGWTDDMLRQKGFLA